MRIGQPVEMKILFITANRVGDAVLSAGLLQWLVEAHPEAQFTIVCGPYAASLFRAVPRLERLVVLKKQSWNRHWLGLWRDLHEPRWDLIVDLRNSLVSRFLHAKKRAYRGRHSARHKVIENAAILNLSPPPAPYIWLDQEASREAARLLPPERPILALAPAANWPCKQWPIERFAELAQMLTAAHGLAPGAPLLVIADTHERAQVEPLLRSISGARPIIGHDLLTVAACLQECRLFIGNDSGLMHIAAAIGTPTLGLFGPGYEEIYGPWGPRSAFIRTSESREELLRRLPYRDAGEPNLMGGLSVKQAYDAAQALFVRTA